MQRFSLPRPARPMALAAALTAGALTPPTIVRAQGDVFLPGTSPLDHAAMQQATLSAHIDGLTLGSVARGEAGGTRDAVRGDLGYRRDPDVSRRVRGRVAAGLKGRNMMQTFALRTAVNGGSVYDSYAQAARRHGLRPDDAGDALTVYAVAMWLLANDPPRQPTPAEVQGTRAQMRAVLAASQRKGALATEAARQEFVETLAHQVALAEMAAAPAIKSGDQAALGRVQADAAAGGRRVLGLDLRALTLTTRGLVRAGGAAGDARAVAAVDAEEAEEAAPAPARATTRAATATRAAGGGVDTEGIAHVVLRHTVTPDMNMGISVSYNPSVLYRDGRAVDPNDRRPDGRGRWRQEGLRTITAEWESGRKSRWENIGSGSYFYARPGAPAGGLNGTYQALSVSTVGEVTAFSARAITFRPDGTFALEGSGGGFGGGSAVSARSQSGGRYRVDGWAITFTYPDGRTQRGLFYRFPDSDRVLGIGGPTAVSTYTIRRD